MTRRHLLAFETVAVLVLAACSPSTTGGPAGSRSRSGAPATAGVSLPSQSDTGWGRIWDGIPPTFPTFTGATPATDTGDGPVSALLAIDEADPAAVAAFYRDALQARNMVAGVDGPLEDGSITVAGSDGYRCAIQVSVRPAGSTNLIAVLYGAGCPFE